MPVTEPVERSTGSGQQDGVSVARSLLFVPGDRPERFEKAFASGTDLVVLDLEDAVAPDAKDAARRHVEDWLGAGGPHAPRVVVRINAVDTPWHHDDLSLVRTPAVATMVPRATAAAVAAVSSALGGDHPLIALVETASGVLEAAEVARTPGVRRLALGSFDLAAELGVDPRDREALLATRGALVLASAAATIAGPVDGVTGAVDDSDELASDLAYAARLGFTGKLCIHPRQVAAVATTLAPSAAEIAWARSVLSGVPAGGVGVVDGEMVDRPVLERARRLLARAEAR